MKQRRAPTVGNAERKLNALCIQTYDTQGTLVVIESDKDREAWRAWRSWRINHDLSVKFMDSCKSWTVPSEFPPENIDQAIRDARPRRVSDQLEL